MERHVPGLGDIKAFYPPGSPKVEQYRGIPYGSVPARFRQAKLVTGWPDNKWDGTKYGPLCPFPKIVIGSAITQKTLPAQHDYEFDEFRCLNLNVTCPKGSTPEDGLPVMVWIHGGGNCVGTGADPGYDGAPLVNFSVDQKLPVVVVTVSFRLGAFGFLASEAIREDNEAAGDKGVGNYGIRDQLLAYEWVKKNIKAFGGNPNHITGWGESAGSIDIHITLCSELFESALPFQQAILQSGVGSLTIRSAQHQETVCDKLMFQLKIPNGDTLPKDRLRALREVPADDLVLSYIALGSPVPAWQATVDGYFLNKNVTASTLSSQKYHSSFKRVLMGDCAAEGLIFALPLQNQQWNFERVHSLAVEVMGAEQGGQVLQAYGISADLSKEELFSALVKLVSDAEWSQPMREVARSFSNGDVFYYHMAEGNPFDGPNKGMAHHTVDLLYIFLTYQEHLPGNLPKLAETIAGQWLRFVHGDQPWKAYDHKADGSSTLMYYGPTGQNAEVAESTKPAYGNIRLCEMLQDSVGRFAGRLHGVSVKE